MESKIRHLEMIQAIIDRMARNSFMLKEWTVLAVSALFVLAVGVSGCPLNCLIALFPTTAFWLLDGYYLWQERLFRKLYDKVRVLDEEDVDFSMNTSSVVPEVDRWLSVTFSKTLVGFYGAVLATICVACLISLAIK